MPIVASIPQQLTETPSRATETGSAVLRRGFPAPGAFGTRPPGESGSAAPGTRFGDLVSAQRATGASAGEPFGDAVATSQNSYRRLNSKDLSAFPEIGREAVDQSAVMPAAIASTPLAMAPGTGLGWTAPAAHAEPASGTAVPPGRLGAAAPGPLPSESGSVLPRGHLLPHGGSELPRARNAAGGDKPNTAAAPAARAAISNESGSLIRTAADESAMAARQTVSAQDLTRLVATVERSALQQQGNDASSMPPANSVIAGVDHFAAKPVQTAGPANPVAIPIAQPARAAGRLGLSTEPGGPGARSAETATIISAEAAATTVATHSGRPALFTAPAGSSPAASGFSPLAFAGAGQVDSDALSGMLNQRIGMLVRNGIQSARVQLAPEHLGQVDVRITIAEDGASVSFLTQTVSARDALEASLPRLRDLFAEQGLNLTDTRVSSGDERAAHQGARDSNAQPTPIADVPLLSAANDSSTLPDAGPRRADRLVDLFV